MHLRGGAGSAGRSSAGLAAALSLGPRLGGARGAPGQSGAASSLSLSCWGAWGYPASHPSSSSPRAAIAGAFGRVCSFLCLCLPPQPRRDAPGAAQLPGPALSLPASLPPSPSALALCRPAELAAPGARHPPDFSLSRRDSCGRGGGAAGEILTNSDGFHGGSRSPFPAFEGCGMPGRRWRRRAAHRGLWGSVSVETRRKNPCLAGPRRLRLLAAVSSRAVLPCLQERPSQCSSATAVGDFAPSRQDGVWLILS